MEIDPNKKEKQIKCSMMQMCSSNTDDFGRTRTQRSRQIANCTEQVVMEENDLLPTSIGYSRGILSLRL